MKKKFIRTTLVIGILVLFIGAGIVPTIIGDYNNEQDTTSLTFYTFNKTGTKECKVELPTEIAEEISIMFEALKNKITNGPVSDETLTLKNDFVEILDTYGLIPPKLSKDYVFSLLNPRWLRHAGSNNPFIKDRDLNPGIRNGVLPGPFANTGSAFFCSIAGGGYGLLFTPIMFPRPRLATIWSSYIDAHSGAANLLTGRGFIASGSQFGIALGFMGIGLSFAFPGEPASFGFGGYALSAFVGAEDVETYPLNQIPVISEENPPSSTWDVPVSLSELSFRISDPDKDRMSYTVTTEPDVGSGEGSGFDGVYTIPINGLHGNTEYTWSVVVTDKEDIAEKHFSFHTEVVAPLVSDPLPVDGDNWVPLNLTKLSFKLEDLQGDLMDYTIETVPDIGAGSGNGVGNGIYSVEIGSLEHISDYIWYVNVTDGEHWTGEVYDFKTQPLMVFDPFDESWMYRKQVVINHSQVIGDLENFPILLSIIDNDLHNKAQNDGDDILFMDKEGEAMRLFHEIETYDGSTGRLTAWINLTSLNSSLDSFLYMYYGNPNCTNQQTSKLVWDSNYVAVWHMNSLLDSTLNDFELINNGPIPSATGKIGKCYTFDENENDHLVSYNILNAFPIELTIESWYHKTDDNDEHCIMQWYVSSSKRFYFRTFDDERLNLRPFGNGNFIYGPSKPSSDKWFYCTFTYVKNGLANIWINDEKGAGVEPGSISSGSGGTLFIGSQDGKMASMQGYLDEIRISNVLRSDIWISTGYNNQNDPSNFISLGLEETDL